MHVVVLSRFLAIAHPTFDFSTRVILKAWINNTSPCGTNRDHDLQRISQRSTNRLYLELNAVLDHGNLRSEFPGLQNVAVAISIETVSIEKAFKMDLFRARPYF